MAITDYHRAIFTFLETYRHEHPEAKLTYSLRRKNKADRPRNLYLFTGSENYIFVGLYAPNNSKKKTRTIGFHCNYSLSSDSINQCSLEIGYDDPKLNSQEIIYQQIIQQVGAEQFDEYSTKRYELVYKDPDWQKNLQTYLEQHKPIIDEVIQQAGATNVFEISEQELEEDIEAINQPQQTAPSTDTNYWVFQGNPAQFRIIKALEDNALQTWRVAAHSQQIKPDDKIILWVTGPSSGCYALAEVASAVYTGTDETGEEYYQLTGFAGVLSPRVKIRVLLNLWDRPIRKADLQNLPAFAGFKGGNQGTNFTATQQQYETIEQLAQPNNIPVPVLTFPKNIILYGPPGTGKTFGTIDLAVAIIDGQKSPDHQTNKARFDQLRKDGQIEFVTFHQNYTYEDFVTGLKPDVEAGSLKFEEREGIFYKIAKQARSNFNASRNQNPTISLRPFETVFEKFMQPLVHTDTAIDVPMASGLIFRITKVGERSVLFEKSNGSTKHTLSISTLKRIYEGLQDAQPNGLKPYYVPLSEELAKLGRQTRQQEPLKHYVLIIDEINRANMSRVFGELITLLEEDKRLGEPNELTVTLPSGEPFAVPPNLYLIGTMNTADKSLALLDIALRRRFEFIYQKPDSSLLKAPMDGILDKLNQAIRGHHKSADFLIGHAYFMDKTQNQLPGVFNNRVIPLLLEYFNGNAKTVIEVLAKAGVTATQDPITDQLTVSHVG